VGRVEKNPEFLGDLIDQAENLPNDEDIIFSQNPKYRWKTGNPETGFPTRDSRSFLDSAREALATLRARHTTTEEPATGSDAMSMMILLLHRQERNVFAPILNSPRPCGKPNLSDDHLKKMAVGHGDKKEDLLEGSDPQLAAKLLRLFPSSSFPKGGRDKLFRVLSMAAKTGGRIVLLADNRTIDDELGICAAIKTGQRSLVPHEILNLLLEYGAKPWASDLGKLRAELSGASWIVDMGGTLVAVVLREGSSIAPDGNTPLHIAVRGGPTTPLHLLLTQLPLLSQAASYVDFLSRHKGNTAVRGEDSPIASKSDKPLDLAVQCDWITLVNALGNWDVSQPRSSGNVAVLDKCDKNAIVHKAVSGP
jgi:hypothetical protein